MTDQPILRGDRTWRRRDDGGWEVWSAETDAWVRSAGPPPPPNPPGSPPAEAVGTSREPERPRDGGHSSRARTILFVVGLAWLAAIVLWLGARDWLFGGDSPAPSPQQQQPLAACGAQPPPAPRQMQFDRPPKKELDPKVDYSAIIRTSCGDMEVDLLEDEAPKAVNNFVFLARAGFYNGLVWHHVTPDFIIQTGDPNGINGQPPDGPGYTIPDELPDNRKGYVFGTVGFANAGPPDSSGSQFFVVVHDLEGAVRGEPKPLKIEPTYTIFGRVPEKFFGSIQEIAQQPTLGGTNPLNAVRPRLPIYLNSVQIVES